MSALTKALFGTALSLLLSKFLVEAMMPVQPGQGQQRDDNLTRPVVLPFLRRIMAANDNQDPCMALDRDEPNAQQMAAAKIFCSKAMSGFNLLVSNNEVPAGWRNPCYMAYAPKCRRLEPEYGRFRCAVKLPYKPSKLCCFSREPQHRYLRRCAQGLIIPEN